MSQAARWLELNKWNETVWSNLQSILNHTSSNKDSKTDKVFQKSEIVKEKYNKN